MMPEYTPEEREALRLASQARSELEQTETAFDTVRDEMLQAWAATKLGEADRREQLYMGIQVLDRVRGVLRMAVADGELAKKAGEIRACLASDNR